MKGLQGLIVAGLLGLLAVALNWVYLQQKTADVDKVMFLGVKKGVAVSPPDTLSKDDLEAVPVPRLHAGNLKDYVFLYRDLKTVVGISPSRAVRGGELLPRSIYATPPATLKLKADERLFTVSVASQSFVPALVNPGDEVTFVVPVPKPAPPAAPAPTVDDDSGAALPPPPAPVVNTTAANYGVELIGPFTVASVGNRLGSTGALRASRKSQVQERQIGIVVKTEGDQYERQAMKLIEQITRNNSRNIGVVLHPPGK